MLDRYQLDNNFSYEKIRITPMTMILDFNLLSPAITVNEYTDGHQRAPSIASLSDNKTVILWEDRSGQDTSASGVFGQVLDGSLTKIGPEFLVPVDTFNWQTVPKVVSDGDDSILTNWSAKISRVMNLNDEGSLECPCPLKPIHNFY